MNQQEIIEMNERFESAIREKLTGFEPKVPHALWGKISAELTQQEFKVGNTVTNIPVITLFRNWKVAAAAAIVISFGAGLFMSQNQMNGINSTFSSNSEAVSTPLLPVTISPMAVVNKIEEVPVVKNKEVVKAKDQSNIVQTAVVEIAPINATEPDVTEELTVAQNETLIGKPETTVDMGNIPMFSLKLLSSPSSLNDEITIIQSVQDKKHPSKLKEDKTKVIFMGKKFDKKPAIDYTVPVRF